MVLIIGTNFGSQFGQNRTTLSFIGSVLMIYKIVVVKGMNGGVVHLKTLSLPVNPQRLWSLLVANDNNIKNLYIISTVSIIRYYKTIEISKE